MLPSPVPQFLPSSYNYSFPSGIPLLSTVQAIPWVHICLLGAAVYLITRALLSGNTIPLPRGPTRLPVIGNLLQIPSNKHWEYCTSLGKKYGDISCVSVLGTHYIILNSFKSISAILEKQSIKCSNRPRLTVHSDLVGWINGTLFMDYDDRLRQHRKFITRLFGSRDSAAEFSSIGEEETRRFLGKVLQRPEDLFNHIRFTASAVFLKVTYGYSVQEGHDPFMELAEKTITMTMRITTPGTFLVDLIPVLRYLPEWCPGMQFLQEAKKYRRLTMEMVQRPHQYVVEQMASGTAVPSFSSRLLEGGMSLQEEDLLKWTSTNVYLGATDTTASTIHTFFLAMVLYPDVQTKAQAELDSVIGSERLPCAADRDSLPYINAVWKEVLRWHSPAPLAMAHVATEDIIHDGYLIPKGSRVLGNAWGVLHDESVYPDPQEFCPERFLGDTPQPDPQSACFGFGRRRCPGAHLAEASLFIWIAMSLAVLKISKQVIDGVQIPPNVDFTHILVSHFKPFRCEIIARSPMAEALLRD